MTDPTIPVSASNPPESKGNTEEKRRLREEAEELLADEGKTKGKKAKSMKVEPALPVTQIDEHGAGEGVIPNNLTQPVIPNDSAGVKAKVQKGSKTSTVDSGANPGGNTSGTAGVSQ